MIETFSPMKKTKANEVAVCYQLKNGWKLRSHQMEHPKGVSQTVPDNSYSIADLITKFAGHLDPSITKQGHFNGDDDEVDFDDIDLGAAARADYHEVDDLRKEAAERQATLLRQMDEAKKKAKPDGKIERDEDDDAQQTGGQEKGKIPVKGEAKKPVQNTDENPEID